MPTPFTRWSDEITTAVEPKEKAVLLKEIASWRAQNLTDLDGVREAAFAISRLLDQLGKRDLALKEALALVSLCQTKPVALPQMMESAVTYVGVLGGKMPRGLVKHEKPRRKAKSKVGGQSDKPNHSLVQTVMEHLSRGHDRNAIKALTGKKGPAVALLRTFVDLEVALATEDAGQALAAVAAIRDGLRGRYERQIPKPVVAAPASEATSGADNRPPREGREEKKARFAEALQLASNAIAAGADVDALVPLINNLDRRNGALKAAERLVESGLTGQLEVGVVNVLTALDSLSKPAEFFTRGQGLAVAVAAQCGTAGPAAVYLTTMPGAEGFASAGLAGVTALSGSLAAAGLPTFMVLHGTTKRERESDEVLGTFGSDLGGLWRIIARNGRDRVEAWYLSGLTPAGQGAVARLLLDDKRHRVVVLDGSEELAAWYTTLGAPSAVEAAQAGELLSTATTAATTATEAPTVAEAE